MLKLDTGPKQQALHTRFVEERAKRYKDENHMDYDRQRACVADRHAG
jgi:hypothetical protein